MFRFRFNFWALAALLISVLAFPALATDHDLRQPSGVTPTKIGGPAGGHYVMDYTWDFATNPVTAADTGKVFHFPINTVVENVLVYVIDAPTTTANTIDVGDSADADGFLDGISLVTEDTWFNSFRAGNTLVSGVLNFFDEDVAANQSAVEWGTQPATDVGGALKRVTMPFAGSVVGVSLYTATAHTTGTITADATISGTVTGLQAAATAGTATAYGTQAMGLDNFTAGQTLGVKVTTLSTLAATTTDWRASVFYVSDGSTTGPTAYCLGKKYTAANYLSVLWNNTCTSGKVRFKVLCRQE